MSSRRSRSLTAPERPRGGRWRRPAWKDPRMAGGVMLVAAAVAMGAWAVDAAADTTRVYVLSQDVAPGADLTADGVLTVVEAHPGTDAYVEAGHLPDGAVSTRSMRKGELLATAAVHSGREQDLRPVVLNVASNLPASTKVGDYVDLWVVPKEGVAGRPAAQASATAQAGQDRQSAQSSPGDQSGQAEGTGARRVAVHSPECAAALVVNPRARSALSAAVEPVRSPHRGPTPLRQDQLHLAVE